MYVEAAAVAESSETGTGGRLRSRTLSRGRGIDALQRTSLCSVLALRGLEFLHGDSRNRCVFAAVLTLLIKMAYKHPGIPVAF